MRPAVAGQKIARTDPNIREEARMPGEWGLLVLIAVAVLVFLFSGGGGG